MRSISPAVAARSIAASPMTHRRTGECPTSAATLTAVPRPSTASRYSGKVSNGHSVPNPEVSASKLMPSTFSSVRNTSARCSGRVGATPKPQLPIMTVVTPCQGEIESIRSQNTCAS